MLNSHLKKISKTLIQSSLVIILGFVFNLGIPGLSKAEVKSKSVMEVIKEEIVEKVFGDKPSDSLSKGLVEEESENKVSSEENNETKKKEGNVLKKVFEKLAVTPEDKEEKKEVESSKNDNVEEATLEKEPSTDNANKTEKKGLLEKAFNKLVNKEGDKSKNKPQSNLEDPEIKETAENKEPKENNETPLPKEEKSLIEKTIQTLISPLEDDKSKKAEVSTEEGKEEVPPKMEEKSLIEKTIQTLVSPLEEDKEKEKTLKSKSDNKLLPKEKNKVVEKKEEVKGKDKAKKEEKDEPGLIEKTIQALTPSGDSKETKKEKNIDPEKKKIVENKEKIKDKDKAKKEGKEEPGLIEKTIQALTPSGDSDEAKKEKDLKKEKLNVATTKPENENLKDKTVEKNFIEKTIQNLISPLEDKKENQVAQQPKP